MKSLTQHSQWGDVKKICAMLREHGHMAWLAGGCVRDGLLNRKPKDFDVATDASPMEVEKIFEKTVAVGKSFGVIRVILGKSDVEVVTFREEGQYTDGRHPDRVEESTPEKDALRRDFTVNALFYDLDKNEIHDFVEGQLDLKKKLLRTVGNPVERFKEDHLRVLRAVRFAAQLGFKIEDKTWKAVKAQIKGLSGVSIERIHEEMTKFFASPFVFEGVALIISSGLLKQTLPEVSQNVFKKGPWKKLAGLENQAQLGWLATLNAVSKKNQEEFLRRLKFSNHEREFLLNALEATEKFKKFRKLKTFEKRKLAAKPEAELALHFLMASGKVKGGIISGFVKKNRTLPYKFLQAADLIQLDVKPGPIYSEILEEAFELQLDGKLKTRTAALAWLKKKVAKLE